MRDVVPFGSWPSKLGSDRLTAGALSLAHPQLDGGRVHWLEGRPSEGGRQVVMCADASGLREVTPSDVNVRSRVHEYGGGAYRVRDGWIFFVDFADARIRARRNGETRTFGAHGSRYADLELSPDGRWLLAVEEIHGQGEPVNRIVAFALDAGALAGGGAPRVVAEGHDFVSFPRFSPDGRQLAFTAWEHPNMPWDGTRLFVREWGSEGPAGPAREVAGGTTESIFQPGFSPDGTLTFVSDRSGWWNLYQLRDSEIHPLCPREAEFGAPQWGFAMSTWASVSDDVILCCYKSGGRDRLAWLRIEKGWLEDIDLPFSALGSVQVQDGTACFLGASPTRALGVYSLDLATHELRDHRSSLSFELDPEGLAVPEEIEFPSVDGRNAYAFFYPPRNENARGPDDRLPPLLVKSHGGPTASTSSTLNPRIQYWTQRGIAVVDVNYGGSTGYGRAYRDRLRGKWGIVDVEDCVQAALFLAADGRVDRERLAISGGSAGGYTTLCALTFHDVFHAGASHYGIGDLEALARDTHKFESRYLEGLIGPYPERKDLYVARSPIHFCDRLRCPVAFFQGLEDKVVPPSQAEAMVAALAKRGIPHAYVAFPGEQHGFRRAENICTALDGELYFYSEVFGFEVDVHPPQVRITR